MLGISIDKVRQVRFPVLATPKLDGIRCITSTIPVPLAQHESTPLCRSLKNVPNDYIYEQIGGFCVPGLDGEILTYTNDRPDNFNAIQSCVMSHHGECEFKYHVFDYVPEALMLLSNQSFSCPTYQERVARLRELKLPKFCDVLVPVVCEDMAALEKFEQECVERGHEGVCFRVPESPYKCGRSTGNEQYLVKMKRFITAEAVIESFAPRRHNANDPTMNKLGYQSRSTHKENMVQLEELGALICVGGFRIGTGFTAQERVDFWQRRDDIRGHVVQYKYQPHGQKDLPRIPVFVGFRARRDMDSGTRTIGELVNQPELNI